MLNFFRVSKDSEEVRPYCKLCHSELALIGQYKKKLKIVLSLSNGKCVKCNSNILKLPTFQFHHLNSDKKTVSWRKIKGKGIDYIIKKLKVENVIVLCSNCHLKEQATILKKYYSVILKKNIFQLTPSKINDLILGATHNIIKKIERMHIREKIREWISSSKSSY